MLRRVIALLVALALVAERAAARPLPVRCLVLWILRRADGLAGAFVFDATGMPPSAMQGFAPLDGGPDDAPRLAARFLALAAALGALLPPERPFGRRPARRGLAARRASASGHGAPGAGRRPGGWTPKPHDTS